MRGKGNRRKSSIISCPTYHITSLLAKNNIITTVFQQLTYHLVRSITQTQNKKIKKSQTNHFGRTKKDAYDQITGKHWTHAVPFIECQSDKNKKRRDIMQPCNRFNHTFLPKLYYHMGIYDGCSKFKVYKLAEQGVKKKTKNSYIWFLNLTKC